MGVEEVGGSLHIGFGDRVDGPYTETQLREALPSLPPGVQVWMEGNWMDLAVGLDRLAAQRSRSVAPPGQPMVRQAGGPGERASALEVLAVLLAEYRDKELTQEGFVETARREFIARGLDLASLPVLLSLCGESELAAVCEPANPQSPTAADTHRQQMSESSGDVSEASGVSSDHRVDTRSSEVRHSSKVQPTRVGVIPRRSRRKLAAILGVAVVALAAIAGVAYLMLLAPDKSYLQALRSAGFGGVYPSEASAIAYAKSLCSDLQNGSPPEGQPVDLVAVDAYCPQFSPGFHVLETRDITGRFTLIDTGVYSSGITTFDSGCSGSGGYSDIGPGTTVVVKNDLGNSLASTTLGAGSGNSVVCEFEFGFTVTEGEDDYIVSVSHRGESHHTWTQLTTDGVGLTLGD